MLGNHVADAAVGLELGVGDVILGRRDQLGRLKGDAPVMAVIGEWILSSLAPPECKLAEERQTT